VSLLEGDDVTLDDLRRMREMGYGLIPRGMRTAPVAARRAPVSASCPNCGAPVNRAVCAYCRTRLLGVDSLNPNADDCPRCGEFLDSDELMGDSRIIARYLRCPRCGWTNMEMNRWRQF
jgi:predicted RNA-binding Zn-ribbon protein involved in translation (DUF1610 family)